MAKWPRKNDLGGWDVSRFGLFFKTSIIIIKSNNKACKFMKV